MFRLTLTFRHPFSLSSSLETFFQCARDTKASLQKIMLIIHITTVFQDQDKIQALYGKKTKAVTTSHPITNVKLTKTKQITKTPIIKTEQGERLTLIKKMSYKKDMLSIFNWKQHGLFLDSLRPEPINQMCLNRWAIKETFRYRTT